MLESTLNSNAIYFAMVAVTIGGIFSKFIISVGLKKLVQASSDMSKSTNRFMKLVRAKFEHACMVNDHVENIDVFVDKYIHEHTIWGIRLHGWQRLERTFLVLLGILTLYSSAGTYYYAGFSQIMLQRTMIGVSFFILLLGIYQLVDEKFRIQAMKIYMVDYLENVCALRYARTNEKKEKTLQEKTLQEKGNCEKTVGGKDNQDYAGILEEQLANIELKRRLKKEEAPEQSVNPFMSKERNDRINEKKELQLRAQEEAEKRMELKRQKQEEYMPNEATIREILQEFMA